MPGDSSDPGTAGQGKRQRSASGVDRVTHSLALLVALYTTWMLLSGHFEIFLLSLGVLSCVLVVAIALRMDVVDRESFPIHLTSKAVIYWLWLLKEIWLAAIDVTKRVLAPGLAISPTLIDLEATQQSELGRVIYANSITLTPGTYTIRVYGNRLLVHAIAREAADGLAEGGMDRRITALETG